MKTVFASVGDLMLDYVAGAQFETQKHVQPWISEKEQKKNSLQYRVSQDSYSAAGQQDKWNI